MISQTLFPFPQPSYLDSSHTTSLTHTHSDAAPLRGMRGFKCQQSGDNYVTQFWFHADKWTLRTDHSVIKKLMENERSVLKLAHVENN